MKLSNSEIQLPVIHPLTIQQEEMEILIDKEKVSMEIWAEENYVIPDLTAALPGPWSNYYTPYQIEPMQRLSAVGHCQVTEMKCSQAAGSELTNIFIGCTIDQAPAPTLLNLPREDDTNRRINTRIRPMFKACPKLLRHLPNQKAENLNSGKETILDNEIIYISWSGSPAALADNPVCYVILDEVGKYPPKSGRESDPVSLAKKRVRTFKGRWKILVISTPVIEDDLIHAEYKKSDRRSWWIKCPHCFNWHLMSWWNVVIDKDKDANFLEPETYADGIHSRYVCPACGVLWSEQERWLAASGGIWCPESCKVIDGKIIGQIPNTNHFGYHIHALMLAPMFCTVADLAAEWVAANREKQTGNKEPLQDFFNSQLGLPFYEIIKKTDEKQLTSHKGDYKMLEVPEYVQIITQHVDVQKDHFYISAVGFGYLYQSAIIYYDRLESGDTSELANWGPVEEFLKMRYSRQNKPDEKLSPIVTAIDVGYNTQTAFNFIRKITWAPLIAVKGDPSVRAGIYRRNDKDHAPIPRFDINVNEIKNTVHELLFRAEMPGPGYMQIPKDASFELLQQLCSEERRAERVGKRKIYIWIPKDSHRPNHWWDNVVGAKFAADLLGARMLRDPGESKDNPQRRTGKMNRFNNNGNN
jgi:phage terminase large subunit GpA-like protein